MGERSDIFSITGFFSVLVHAIIVLGVTFRLPDIKNQPNVDNNLEIVLINSSNQIRDEDADTISVEDNQGGGNSEQAASSPLEFRPTTADPIESIKLTAQAQTQPRRIEDQLLTAPSTSVSISAPEPSDIETLETPEATDGESLITTKSARQLERERLIAKIQQAQVDYQKRPKKAFLSPSTKAEGSARYLLNWKNRIQTVGNDRLPSIIREQQLIGIVILSVEINPNGTIAKIVVNRPSRHKVLNDYAQQILRQASPFEPFPDEDYFKNLDILVITRSFEFDPQNGFQNRAVSQNR